ncbi:hypothetical protein BLNAU_2284 [Blattamonas nauphoetae]|uniref:DUF4371 domain-containing protein n=1 Tax=Blattamonas nauphoetae TaxID=2049346 RepID=A0ABQ9YGG0_9EUKA|nr:hypothetical protein BLNAU_2284 [Blattamonas nauphoetae]
MLVEGIPATKFRVLCGLLDAAGGIPKLFYRCHTCSDSYWELVALDIFEAKEKVIAEFIQPKPFSILMDESTDVTDSTQIAIMIRRLDEKM